MRVKDCDLVFKSREVSDGGDAIKFRCERIDALALNLRLIHATLVIVRDLLLVAASAIRFFQQPFENIVQDILVLLVEQLEAAPP